MSDIRKAFKQLDKEVLEIILSFSVGIDSVKISNLKNIFDSLKELENNKKYSELYYSLLKNKDVYQNSGSTQKEIAEKTKKLKSIFRKNYQKINNGILSIFNETESIENNQQCEEVKLKNTDQKIHAKDNSHKAQADILHCEKNNILAYAFPRVDKSPKNKLNENVNEKPNKKKQIVPTFKQNCYFRERRRKIFENQFKSITKLKYLYNNTEIDFETAEKEVCEIILAYPNICEFEFDVRQSVRGSDLINFAQIIEKVRTLHGCKFFISDCETDGILNIAKSIGKSPHITKFCIYTDSGFDIENVNAIADAINSNHFIENATICMPRLLWSSSFILKEKDLITFLDKIEKPRTNLSLTIRLESCNLFNEDKCCSKYKGSFKSLECGMGGG